MTEPSDDLDALEAQLARAEEEIEQLRADVGKTVLEPVVRRVVGCLDARADADGSAAITVERVGAGFSFEFRDPEGRRLTAEGELRAGREGRGWRAQSGHVALRIESARGELWLDSDVSYADYPPTIRAPAAEFVEVETLRVCQREHVSELRAVRNALDHELKALDLRRRSLQLKRELREKQARFGV